MLTKTSKKRVNFFVCEICDYSTSRQFNLDRHFLTPKHKMLTNANKNEQKTSKFFSDEDSSKNLVVNTKNFECPFCGKEFSHRSSLSRHQKKCNYADLSEKSTEVKCQTINAVNNEENINLDILKKLESMEQNNKTLLEKIEKQKIQHKILPSINNSTLIYFLNEECKNAMNLGDFMGNIMITMDDLNYTKDNGYVIGISNIFKKHLGVLAPTERPIHCSDKEKMHFYIKSENEWKKEEGECLNKEIDDISQKQIQTIKKWEQENPDWQTQPDKIDEYLKIIKTTCDSVKTDSKIFLKSKNYY